MQSRGVLIGSTFRPATLPLPGDEGTSAWRLVARSLAGDVVAELKVRRKTKLGELRAQLREARAESWGWARSRAPVMHGNREQLRM